MLYAGAMPGYAAAAAAARYDATLCQRMPP